MSMPKLPTKRDPWYMCLVISLVVITFLMFCFTMFVNFIASPDVLDIGWFENGIGGVSDEYNLDITPAGYTFSIWGLIYFWQACWIIYVLTTLCRRNQYGAVFVNPPIVTPFFLFSFCLNLTFNILWLFLFDKELQVWAFLCIFMIFLSLEGPILISNHVSVDKYGKQLRKDHHKDLLAIRILIQNGLALYRTWVLIATSLSFGIVLTYEGGVNQSTSGTIGLVIVAFAVILDFVVDTFVWDRYLRYTFAHWGVYIWALIGVLAGNWDRNSTNSILTILLLFLTIILLLIKIPIVVWRHRNRPLYVENVQSIEDPESE